MRNYTEEDKKFMEIGSQFMFKNSIDDTVPELVKAGGDLWEIMDGFLILGKGIKRIDTDKIK